MRINLKKKENIIVLGIIMVVLSIVSIIPINTNAAIKSKYYKAYLGDVDLDGKVTSADSRLILRMSVGLEEEKALADINRDGKISSEDSRLALKMSVEEESLKQIDTYVDRFGNVAILYKQNDSTNKNQKYLGRYNNGKYITTWNGKKIYGSKQSSNPNLGENGCGPTSCAIVASSFGKAVTPKSLVNGNKTCYSTSEDIEKYFKGIGLKTQRIERNIQTYANNIANGKKLIVLAGTSSNYSTAIGKIGGYKLGNGTFHWYTILDYDGNGNFYVADPYLWSGKNSNCKWINFSNLTGIYATIAVSK